MIGTIFSSLAGITAVSLILSVYKKCPADKILVKYGVGGNKIYSGKGTLVLPFFQGYKLLSLAPQNLDITLRNDSGVVSNDKIRIVIEADATFAISKNEDERKIASERLLSMSPENVRTLATEILTGQLRSIVSEMTFEALLQDRKQLLHKVSESTELELTKFGLDLLNFNIKMIKDLDGIVDQLGKKASATATSGAQIATAEQEKVASTKVAATEAERDIKIAEHKTNRDTSLVETNTKKEIKIAEMNAMKSEELAKSQTAKTKAEQERVVAENQMISNSEKLINSAKIEVHKDKELKEAEALQLIAEKEKITIIKQSEVELELKRMQEVLIVIVENEKKEAEEATRLKIEKMKADNEASIAETKAKSVLVEAESRSKAIIMEANAEAQKLALPIFEKAKAEEKLLEVYGREGLLQLKFLEILPEITKHQVEAMKNFKIDSINVISGGENGNVGGEIGGTVRDIMRSIPAFKMANDLSKAINLPNIDILGEKNN